jgi:hypothetical protein
MTEKEALERIIYDLNSWCETWTPTSYTDPRISLTMIANRAKSALENKEEIEPSHIIKCDDFLYYRGEKYQKVKEPPRMELERTGKVSVVFYDKKPYYRIEYGDEFHYTVWWRRSRQEDTSQLSMITDKETERLLEGLWFNDVKGGQYD